MNTVRKVLTLCVALACVGCSAKPVAPAAPEPVVPAGWTTRENVMDGMVFSLPADWVADTSVGSAIRYNGNGSVLNISMTDTDAADLNAYLAKLDADQSAGYEGGPSVKNLSTERGAIGGQESELRKQDMLAAGMQSQVAYVVHKGKAYGFMLYSDTGEALTKQQESTFKQILSTVGFKN